MSDRITVVLHPDGTTDVDIDLPPGAACDAEDALTRAILAILGVGIEETGETPRRAAVPNGIPQKAKVGGGG